MKKLLLTIGLLFSLFNMVFAQVNEADSLELVRFYEANNDGDSWSFFYRWLEGPVSTWEGVVLYQDGARVKDICIDEYGSYWDPDTLVLIDFKLSALRTLKFTDCVIGGEIPDFTGIPRLRKLQIEYSIIEEKIPNFSNLPKLTHLTLFHNQINDSISDFANLPKLTYIDLSHNQLSGSIPNFTNLPELYHLDLSHNQLSGSIPNFTNLPELYHLDLSHNQLSGSIPNFTNLPELYRLNLSHNQLSDTIPDFANLTTIKDLELQNNQLSGSIPEFTNSIDLGDIDLSNNQLTGSIPSFANISLTSLNLKNNQLTGTIPAIYPLHMLFISNNQLTGPLSVLIDSEIMELHIDKNQFNFDDIEFNILYAQPYDFIYSPQACIPIHKNGDTLYVSAGGTLSNNTYYWYKDGTFLTTIEGDSTFIIPQTGTYTCEVDNDLAPELILCTPDFVVSANDVCTEESDCVWPGDTNRDGIVSTHDLFNIGRAYDHTGISRSSGDHSWEGQLSDSWGTHFVDGVDFKHVDCNGDGTINHQDIEAIYANYGRLSGKKSTISEEGVPLFAVLEETIMDSIEHSFSIHLGDAENIAEDTYFIAFSLRFSVADAEVRVNNPMLSFEDSWLNQAEGNIIHLDTCFHETPTEWVWDIALSRTNKETVSDFGEICKVSCIMDVINIDGKTSVIDLPLNINIENVRLLSYNAIETPVTVPNTQTTTIIIETEENTPTNLPELIATPEISLFPNPIQSNQNLLIDYVHGIDPIHITLYDITGQQLLQRTINSPNKYQLYIPELTTGTYFIHIWDEQGQERFVEKLIVY